MRRLPLVLGTLLSLTACDALDGDRDLDGDEVHGSDGSQIENAIEVATVELARIDLGADHVVFSIDADGPDRGAITVLEAFAPDKNGQLQLRDSGELSPLELFLELTPASTRVPRALATAGESAIALESAAERGLVDRIETPIDGVAGPGAIISNWSAATMCNEGTTSAQFLDEICPLDDHWTLNYCHNGTWYSVTDDTFEGHKAEWSRGRTLACNGNGRQRHYYKFWGVWYKPIDNPIPSGNLYRYTRQSTAGTKLRRQVVHSRTGSGFVRATSDFFRFPF